MAMVRRLASSYLCGVTAYSALVHSTSRFLSGLADGLSPAEWEMTWYYLGTFRDIELDSRLDRHQWLTP
ncbi:hypothetical protein EYZ11_005909 [Aspergillus tanneri]|uniref:Uncharacterized protein n=1 Tax=Aspergillus tanneri TaxID=1220188 RepID=A0A4S3JMR1_9EURO|nr:hypothetical protein EYZ11_005909 [Aspergillus tanneri]